MKIVLCDINKDLVKAWNDAFADVAYREDRQDHQIEIVCGNIFDQTVDALVSPANSFGFMDGGLDYLISKTLGWDIQSNLKKYINEELDGELVVGQAVAISTTNCNIPFVISAPTMRVPMILGTNSTNVYLATRAALITMKKCKLDSIVFPGMGTGVGKVPVEICAGQMRQAFEDVFYSSRPSSWNEAQVRHQLLTRNVAQVRDLQYN